MTALSARLCPACRRAGTLSVTVTSAQTVFTAQPPGSHSLSGTQMKTAAQSHATGTGQVTCTACGWSRAGRLEGATWDADGVATGGHLVIDLDPDGLARAGREDQS
jgi:hypothetical protein